MKGCIHLSRLGNLTSLNLAQNERISNRGASSLSSLSKLKALNLSYTGVNFEGLRYLSGLLQLQSLALYGHHGLQDSDRIRSLQHELPNLKCLRINSIAIQDGSIDDENGGYGPGDGSDFGDDDILSFESDSNLSNDGSGLTEAEEESSGEDEQLSQGSELEDDIMGVE